MQGEWRDDWLWVACVVTVWTACLIGWWIGYRAAKREDELEDET